MVTNMRMLGPCRPPDKLSNGQEIMRIADSVRFPNPADSIRVTSVDRQRTAWQLSKRRAGGRRREEGQTRQGRRSREGEVEKEK